ncbi:MAG: endonuclease III [Thermoplasmata archaeon]|nr:endonuclease III [Thermoplasmata archaeon]
MDSETACQVLDTLLDHFGLRGFEGIGYDGETPYQILISTILSQQTTEANCRRASERLFAECPSAQKVYETDPARIEELVFCSGYYRQKTRSIVAVTKMIMEEFGGEVPDNPDDLMRLPSVGKKTAACVMRYAYHRPSVIVDTHINRVSNRLGISDSKKPEDTQKAIMGTVPQDRWDDLDITFITLGRTYCRPSHPDCLKCPVRGLCVYVDQDSRA